MGPGNLNLVTPDSTGRAHGCNRLALRHYAATHLHTEPHPRGFLVDFGLTLLFCAAAVALGVLAIELFVEWPRVVVSVGMPMLAVLAALSVHAEQQRRGRGQLR